MFNFTKLVIQIFEKEYKTSKRLRRTYLGDNIPILC